MFFKFIFDGKKSFLVITVTTVTTVTNVTIITSVTTVTTITTNIVKYQMLLLFSSKGNFFTSVSDRPTDRPTRGIELLRAAKKFHWVNKYAKCTKTIGNLLVKIVFLFPWLETILFKDSGISSYFSNENYQYKIRCDQILGQH